MEIEDNSQSDVDNDSEDEAWRVRIAAANTISALLKTSPNMLTEIFQ